MLRKQMRSEYRKNSLLVKVKLEEKALKDRQKELENLLAEQAKLEKEIEDYKKRISENEKAAG